MELFLWLLISQQVTALEKRVTQLSKQILSFLMKLRFSKSTIPLLYMKFHKGLKPCKNDFKLEEEKFINKIKILLL